MAEIVWIGALEDQVRAPRRSRCLPPSQLKSSTALSLAPCGLRAVAVASLQAQESSTPLSLVRCGCGCSMGILLGLPD